MSAQAIRAAVLALAVLALGVVAEASPDDKPPPSLENKASVRAWIEKHKGFGVPEFSEFSLLGRHVLVAWNCPFSGRPSKFSYAFQEQAAGEWKLLDQSLFDPPDDLAYIYLEANSGALAYMSVKGKQLKSVVVPKVWRKSVTGTRDAS